MVLRRFALSVLLLVAIAPLAHPQNQAASPAQSNKNAPLDEHTSKDRSYAMELYNQGKLLEALPWLEKVVTAAPNDAAAHEALGMALQGQAFSLPDSAQRKATRIRARQELLRAKELGDTDDLLEYALAGLAEDGSEPTYSETPELDRILKQGEAAFAAGNWDDAKKAYLQALVLNPNSYETLLFMGDVYYRKGDPVAAGEWFTRAIQVDPNRETAYRYWGDALVKQRKFSAAREKFIQAFIAEPYNERTGAGINNYVRITQQRLTWYKIQSPDIVSKTDVERTTITVDPSSLDKKDGSSAWIIYPVERVLWKDEKFAKAFPGQPYRHSLREEFSALSLVAAAAQQLATGKKHEKLNPDLQALVKLKSDGFLEAYVLLNAVDEGIAQDYKSYRKAHRDVLVRYLSEVVIPPGPSEN